jgi:hypothetical protein
VPENGKAARGQRSAAVDKHRPGNAAGRLPNDQQINDGNKRSCQKDHWFQLAWGGKQKTSLTPSGTGVISKRNTSAVKR